MKSAHMFPVMLALCLMLLVIHIMQSSGVYFVNNYIIMPESSYCLSIGIDGQTVTIVTDPIGIPVDGQPNTFDYPILTNVTLMCITTATDGSPATVTSYQWTATNCYTHADGILDPCFYGDNQTVQNITGNNLLAQDAGTVTCTATVGGVNYTSNPLTLRISGKLC